MLLAAALLAFAAPALAGVTRYCDSPSELSAAQHDRLFRFAAVIKGELDASGADVALVARSGLDLSLIGQRYSHAGFSLRSAPDTPWSVRQLYYACDESKPRIFDQGLSGFLLGSHEADLGFVSAVLVPAPAAAALERAALDKRLALALLGASYSANAYAFSLRHQNCNQWVAEMLAAGWGGLPEGSELRAQAQTWLRGQGYAPSEIDLGWRVLMWAGLLIPWIHADDHPDEDTVRAVYRVSMPSSLEAFVHQREPTATRLEFCHTDRHVVVHRGWSPIAEGCVAGEGDTVVPLD